MSGQVSDENGKPIPGASIGLWTFQRRVLTPDGLKADATTESDAQGKWRLDFAAATTYSVISAYAPGRSMVSSSPGFKPEEPNRATLNFVLLPTRPVRVKFVDWDNRPVPDVSVSLRRRERPLNTGVSGMFYGGTFGTFVPTVTSDAAGQAVIPFGSEGDTLSVKVEDKTHQSVDATICVPSEDGLIIKLIPGGAIRGRLVDTTGKPLANRTLNVNNTDSIARTADDGTFQIDGLEPAPAMVDLVGGDLVLPLRKFEVRRGEITQANDLVATPGALITGVLTDKKTGKPFPNGAYILVGLSNPEASPYRWGRYEAIGADGNIRFRLPLGDFTVNFRLTGPSNGSKSQQLKIEDERPVTINVAMDPTEQADQQPAQVPVATRQTNPKPADDIAPPDYIYGKVTMPDGSPAAGVNVAVLQNGQVIREGKSTAEGKFAIGPLVGEIGINGKAVGLVRGTPGKPAPKIFLRAVAPNFSSKAVVVDPGSDAPISLSLASLSQLRLRVVSSDGKPLVNATVVPKTLKVYSPDEYQPWRNAAPGTYAPFPGPARTDARGEVTFENMPSEGLCRIAVSHAGFADFTHVVALPRKDRPDLVLMRPAVVEGRVLFGDEVLTGKNFNIKIQSMGAAQLWRTALPDAEGRYQIDNLAPTSQLNERQLAINVNLTKDKSEIAPGLSADYVKAGENWNVLLTDTRNGEPVRWICYVDLLPNFEEGEQVVYDFKMAPLAKVTGKLLPAEAGKPLPNDYVIAYQDPAGQRAFSYAPLSVAPDKDGNFEIWVPAEKEVMLDARPKGDRWSTPPASKVIAAIPLGETRQVELKLGSGGGFRSGFTRGYPFRVLGPDNATVPRVVVSYRDPNARFDGDSKTITGLDGMLRIYTQSDIKDDENIRISSPLLDAPVEVKPDRASPPVIRLNRLPAAMPEGSSTRWYTPATTIAAPAQIAVGDEVPEFEVEKWHYGDPVHQAELKGKITVCVADAGVLPQVLPVLNRYQGKVAVIIFSRPNGGLEDPLQAALTGGLPADNEEVKAQVKAVVRAVATDPPIQTNWRGANMYRMGAGSGAAIIGADGRLAAVGLYGNDLAAKIDQLAADLPRGLGGAEK